MKYTPEAERFYSQLEGRHHDVRQRPVQQRPVPERPVVQPEQPRRVRGRPVRDLRRQLRGRRVRFVLKSNPIKF